MVGSIPDCRAIVRSSLSYRCKTRTLFGQSKSVTPSFVGKNSANRNVGRLGLLTHRFMLTGLQTQTAGLKQALLKVRGFNYVPENLRSQTFLKAAEAIVLRAHEGMNNFYNEEAPTINLEKLGTVIPAPALGPCITALLCVRLGNSYGTCWAAVPIASKMS